MRAYYPKPLAVGIAALSLLCLPRAPAATLEWSGYTWNIREWSGSPGPNEWASNCVWQDTNDWLHMAITNISGTWYCGEVSSIQSLSFGEYRWYTVGRPDLPDSNVVIGLFTYFDTYHEVDIEFTYNFQEPPTNLHYTVQPWWESGHGSSCAVGLTNEYTTHRFIWKPRRIEWQSWYGHTAEPSGTGAVIAAWTYEGEDVPGDTNEHVHMNVWLYDGLPPADSNDTDGLKVVLAGFYYAPATGTLFYDDFEDGTTSNMWTRYNDGGGISETSGALLLTPADSAWDALGYRTTNTLAEWDDDGLTYVFSATLRTVDVTAASTTYSEDIWGYHAIVWGPNDIYDAYWATNAAQLRGGYDSSNDTLLIEFRTKTNQPADPGGLRFSGIISNASSYFSTNGLELRFSLVYSNYQVAAYDGTQGIYISPVSGSITGLHELGDALYDSHYVVGGQNADDGRGTVFWEEVRGYSVPELGSVAQQPEEDPFDDNEVQVGTVDYDQTWRSPIDTKYKKSRSQVLYKSAQIGRSGMITQLQIHVLSPPDISMTRYTVRMQHTDLASLSDSFINSGWATVYQEDTLIPSDTSGWYAFNLTNWFEYDSASNLLIDLSFNNSVKDDYPLPAATYSATSADQCYYVSATRDDPLDWTGRPGGRAYEYLGERIVNVRLVFTNAVTYTEPINMSFEDGPRGYLTNVPGWSVIGPVANGYIEGGPSYPPIDGTNLLKLWDGGAVDEKMYQDFLPGTNTAYVLSGYLRSQSIDPFAGSNIYAALVIEWYAETGLIQSAESAHYTPDDPKDQWIFHAVTSAVPDNVSSGRILCALFSSQYYTGGSVLFDQLSLVGTAMAPVEIGFVLWDGFDDNSQSNIWQLEGDWADAEFEETNGLLRVTSGTNVWQTGGYKTSDSYPWDDDGGWFVFSAVLHTIQVVGAQSGEDYRAMIAICSERENAWKATNAISMEGRYDRDLDSMNTVLLAKTNDPEHEPTITLFDGTITSLSSYLDGSNGLRVNIVLGNDSYDLRFMDASGLHVPVSTNSGATTGDHLTGSSIHEAYWLVGGMNANTSYGSVYWDLAQLYTSSAPTAAIGSVAQVSTNGAGLVVITNSLYDPDGNVCRLRVQASTNKGITWFTPWLTHVSGTCTARLEAADDIFPVIEICTSNGAAPSTNVLSLTWDTVHPSNAAALAGIAVTNALVRLLPDDHALGGTIATSAPFVIDNEPPSHLSAGVLVQDGSPYTLSTNLELAWSNFNDAASGISGYYYSRTNAAGSTTGQWTTSLSGQVAGSPNATNWAYVWASDPFGNIGDACFDSIIVLSEDGDWDNDTMPDGWEDSNGLDPLTAADATADGDGDDYVNADEYYWDTNPNSSTSFLDFTCEHVSPSALFLVEWYSATTRTYSLHHTEQDLSNGVPWKPVTSFTNVPGYGGSMVYTDADFSVEHRFYRLSVDVLQE